LAGRTNDLSLKDRVKRAVLRLPGQRRTLAVDHENGMMAIAIRRLCLYRG